MSEFIREVDEEYRQEQIRSLFGRYWVALLALAIAVLIGVGGWRGYVYYRQQRDEAAGSRYFDATELAHSDKTASLAALDALAKDGPTGYQMLARFKAAGEIGSTDASAGVKAFDALAEDQSISQDLRDIAKLRAALLVMNGADALDISRRFAPLADANAPFRNLAREMLAVSALKRGDDEAAKRWLEAEMSDPIAAQDQRQRAGLFLSLIRSGKPGEIAPPPAPVETKPAALVPAPPAADAAPAASDAPAALAPAPVTPDAAAPAAPEPDQPSAAKP